LAPAVATTWKWVLRIGAALVALVVLYLGLTFVQVWLASRRDEARPVQAIVVLGAAQYNGVPSPVLKARLDHAAALYHEGLSDTVVVTGGKEPGDRFTEASASADYLARVGVPQDHVLRENGGRNSWQSLAAAALFLKREGRTSVLLVSDPFHSARVEAMAGELGLHAHVSPTRTSPIKGVASLQHMAKETVEVAAGRIIGFRRLVGLDERVAGVR
jgi:uncharacterized SAM-binding protein YcdF (DUF218 family)